MLNKADMDALQKEMDALKKRLSEYEDANALVLRLRGELRKAEAHRNALLGEGNRKKRDLERALVEKAKISAAIILSKELSK